MNQGDKGTVLKVEAIVGEGSVHLHVIKRLELGEVVGVGGGEEAGAVAVDDGPRVPAVDVEGRRIEPAHLSVAATPPRRSRARSRRRPNGAAKREGTGGNGSWTDSVWQGFGWI